MVWFAKVIGIGDVLAGKYRVDNVLGKGGMGYVVSAVHTQLDQQVAVKFMMPELCEHPEAVARFLREARASVRIRSEHVARVLDVGTLDDGTPYMVMEFLSGHDLATELDEVNRLDVSHAVDYVLQACEALAEAHSHGIIHRDLKPANLFLTQRSDGSALVKVLDFGISKAANPGTEAVASLTASQSLMGSPHYMSPEQVRKPKLVDARSDIWALGVILHELLIGERPFTGDTPMSVLAAVVSDPAPPLRLLREELPAELEIVVLRCLEKEPERRFGSVAELARALERWSPPASRPLIARIEGIVRASGSTPPGLRSAREMTPDTVSVPATAATMQSPQSPILARPQPARIDSSEAPAPVPPPRRRTAWLVAGMSLLGAFGALMYFLGGARSEVAPDRFAAPGNATPPALSEPAREFTPRAPSSASREPLTGQPPTPIVSAEPVAGAASSLAAPPSIAPAPRKPAAPKRRSVASASPAPSAAPPPAPDLLNERR